MGWKFPGEVLGAYSDRMQLFEQSECGLRALQDAQLKTFDYLFKVALGKPDNCNYLTCADFSCQSDYSVFDAFRALASHYSNVFSITDDELIINAPRLDFRSIFNSVLEAVMVRPFPLLDVFDKKPLV